MSYKRKNVKIRYLIVLMILCVSSTRVVFCATFDLKSVELERDLLWIGNAVGDSAPSPLVNSTGINVTIFFNNLFNLSFTLRSGIDYYSLDYLYKNGKAAPAEIESTPASTVLAFIIKNYYVYNFPLTEQFELNFQASPSLLIRVPTTPKDYRGEDIRKDLARYFSKRLRFFYPELAGTFTWNFTENISINAHLRYFLPIFHIWQGESYPFFDQMMFAFGAGFLYKL